MFRFILFQARHLGIRGSVCTCNILQMNASHEQIVENIFWNFFKNSQYSQQPKPAASVNFSHWCKFNWRLISHEKHGLPQSDWAVLHEYLMSSQRKWWLCLGDWIYSLLDQSMFKMEATLWALTALALSGRNLFSTAKSSYDGWMGLII